ncbi:MAG: hypothetical protein NZ805_10875 [Armatimonadetes bacterium]|nr:hypothetical protein [Armatimonadota bacterium]
MKVTVNEVDLSQFWEFQVIDRQLWLKVNFLSDLGVHVYEAAKFNALMVCTEIECMAFSLWEQRKQATRVNDEWFVNWDVFAERMEFLWEQKGNHIIVKLPEKPLPRPLKLGDRVPDIFLWRNDGILFRLYEWAGYPIVLALRVNWKISWYEWIFRMFPVKLTLDFQDLPEEAYADPFGITFQIFPNVPAVGINIFLRWLATFFEQKRALEWLKDSSGHVDFCFHPSLPIQTLLTAWLETIKKPEDAQAWLTLADVQRQYCGSDASVPSYEKAIELSKGRNPEVESWARWRLGVLKWLQGEKEVAREVWSRGSLPKIAQELKGEQLR